MVFLRTISGATAAAVLLVMLTADNPWAAQQPPWPPSVATVSEESPALAPEAALKTFVTPPGYHVELVASEPMIQDPIWMDFDPDGRLWVVEMRGFMPNFAGENERAPVGRISVLEDDNDDGRMDRSTVFLDGLVLPRSLKVLDHGVLVVEPPHLWLARDTNGDLKADTKEEVRGDFGRAQGNPEHNANGLLWALDNWIYTSEHDGHLRLTQGTFEYQRTLLRGQWGLSQDDIGRVYRNWNEVGLYADLFPARYFMRNPQVVRTHGVYELLMDQKDMAVWPARPTRGVNRGYREGMLRPDGSITTYSSAGTPTVYRGDRLPAELRGNVFITDPAANLVQRLIVTEDAASGRLHARPAYARGEFLASTDERFRPVNLFSGPDGTLYVVDMYRGIIQHGAYQSEYLKNHIQSHKLDQPIGRGRIYRVVHDKTTRDKKPALSKLPATDLVGLLSHKNGWWRDTAQRLLVERGDKSAVAALRRLVSSAPEEYTRLHALWTLDGLDALDVDVVQQALGITLPNVRAAGIRLAEPWLRQAEHPLHAAVLKLMDDPSPVVRRQLALSLGELPAAERERPLGDLLERDGGDPIMVDAIVSGLKGHEAAVLDRLLDADGPRAAAGAGAPPSAESAPTAGTAAAGEARGGAATGAVSVPATAAARRARGQASASRGAAARGDAITMLSAAVTASGDAEAIERLFETAARPDRQLWQQLAMLRGMELALPGRDATLGANLLGTSPLAALAAAGPALGGGAGPGTGVGGVAVGAAQAAGDAGTGGGRGGRGRAATRVTLARRPMALLSLQKSQNRELVTLARRVSTLLDWPGKPKTETEAAPLTAEEQKRFTAGQQVFQNLCAACHAIDGRGQAGLGAPLVGSKWVLGRAGLMARIVINGKEGEKMMPPLAMLSDDQIAAVLTYVRRAWGNSASAVDVTLVREVRGASTGRLRPWTEDDLGKVTQPDGPPRIPR